MMARAIDVMFVCRDLDMGGAERHWASLIPALADRQLSVRVVALDGGGRSLETLRQAGVRVTEMKVRAWKQTDGLPLLGVRRYPSLAFGQRRPDVIVSWSYTAHLTSALTARTRRIPHVINWHRQPGNYGLAAEESTVKIAARLGAGAISVTESQLPDLRASGMPAERVRVAHNGTAAPAAARLDRAMLRKELNLTEATSIGVLVARLRPEKRVGDFIEAIAAARKKGADVRGVVVGDGPEEERLRAHAREAGEHVIFVGYQEDPARYVVAGDFLALTSEFEALPMSLIEAAACGRPAVASDVGGIREIVADGQSGIVVAAGDVAKFADAFAMLATDRELAASMGAAASRKWTSEYTFDAMADRYAKLLLNVSGPPVTWGVP